MKKRNKIEIRMLYISKNEIKFDMYRMLYRKKVKKKI